MAMTQVGHSLNHLSIVVEKSLSFKGQRCLVNSHIPNPKRIFVGASKLSSPQTRKKIHMVKCLPPKEEDTENHHEPPSGLVELPLFPLPAVLFPGASLPLQVFEFRYRMMMHTLLETDMRFGVIFSDLATGIVEVGCVGEIVKHERLADDRFFLICKGQERFRVVKTLRTKPYMVAQVTWLEDKPSPSGVDDLEKLADEVETYMKDVIKISNRLNGKGDKEPVENLRNGMFPTPFSFFVGSTFEGAPAEQQALLELEDTATRLKREKETLKNTLNYLTAAAAVNDVFSSPT